MESFDNHIENIKSSENLFGGKILVISNDAMSYSSSNGRSMLMLLADIPSSNIAQFSIHGTRSDDICKSSFQVSDRDAVRAFLHRKQKEEDCSKDKNEVRVYNKSIVRNCRNLFLRNVVWSSFAWWKKDFDAFLKDVSPDIVLLQAGDMPFMYKIARKIAKRFNCPLVMYNTENYVLKDVMYNSASKRSIWHFILRRSLKKEYRNFMKCASYCIYNTEFLEKAYQEKYPHYGKSTAVYMSSKIIHPLEFVKTHSEFSLLYCGNLGVGRSEVLAETAEILHRVDSTAVIDIYGEFPNKEFETMVCQHQNVRFHGAVSYDEVLEQMKHASMLFHCENPDRVKNLQTAFSTKIADNIASGRPFLVYASDEYPFVRYLRENQCAHIAGSAQELEKILKICIEDADYCNQYHKNGINTAFRHHNFQNNAKEVKKILSSLLALKEKR